MPYGNHRGPLGNGPRSGRGRGLCGGSDAPGFLQSRTDGDRATREPGFGNGRGFRNRAKASGLPGWARSGAQEQGLRPDADPEVKRAWLQERASTMEAELKAIQEQLGRLGSSAQ